MVKLFFFNFRFMFLFPIFKVLVEGNYFLFLLKNILSHLVNSNFKLSDSYPLDIIDFVILFKLINQSNELFFLLFNIDIICLQVLIFLFSKDIIELGV